MRASARRRRSTQQVGGDDQIEPILVSERLEPLEHDVQIVRSDRSAIGAETRTARTSMLSTPAGGGSPRPAPDPVAKSPPVRCEIWVPRRRRVARKVQHVSAVGPRTLADGRRWSFTRRLRSKVVTLTPPSCRQSEPHQRVDHSERLQRLLRVEIVPFALVGEVETRADDGHAADTAGAEEPGGGDRLERLFDCEAGIDRRVGRQSALVEPYRLLRSRRPRIRVILGEDTPQLGLEIALWIDGRARYHARTNWSRSLSPGAAAAPATRSPIRRCTNGR